MAKTKICDIAKELNVLSRELIPYINSLGIPAKSSQKTVDDDIRDKVIKHFSGKEQKSMPEEKPVSEKKNESSRQAKKPAPSGNSSAKDPEKKPHKKPAITAVFNSQYAGGKEKERRSSKSGKQGKSAGGRDSKKNNSRQAVHHVIKPRGGAGPIRPDGTRIGEPTLEEQQKMREAEEAKKRAVEEAKKKEEAVALEKARKEKKEQDKAKEIEKAARDKKSEKPVKDDKNSARKKNHGANNNQDRQSRNDDRRNDGKRGNDKKFKQNFDSDNADENAKRGRKQRKDKKDRDFYNDRNKEHEISLEKNGKHHHEKPQQKESKQDEIKSIAIPDKLTLRELAERMKQQPSAVIKKLFMKGIALTLNSELDYDKAEEIALEFNILCEHEKKVDVIEEMLKEEEEDPKDLKARPPVVCVMGHVDHGKTSLLDAIRDTRVTSREAGGITQKIGAYVVDVKGRKITFLDTPGHEAFTAMRMRGANSTDIAVLVVAADDGVMPQTVEAINHAKAAGVEIIVAVNKIDKPNANIDRVKQELAEYELIPEDWGGSTIFVPVSAKTHQGIDDLLEMILLTADVMELKANPDRAARGLIIEAQLDKGKGPVATVLVQKGTLHVGDCISAGSSYGKIRAMSDENGKRVKSAGPSMPVEVQGLSDVPNAGEIFVAHDNEKDARSFAQEFVNEEKEKLVEESRSRMSLDNLFNQVQSGKVKELDIIVKADVQGSVEAVRQSLEKLSNDEVVVRTIHGGVGSITESDVVLASASNAIIIGFNVRPDAVAKEISEREHVDIHLYNVIYNAIEDVESAMKGMLEPVYEEKVIGHAEVRQTFKASGIGIIAGSFVTDGVIERGCKIRLSRGKKQLADVDLLSLKRFKDDAKEVKEGYECGVVLKDFSDIQEGDVMEAYKMVEVPRS